MARKGLMWDVELVPGLVFGVTVYDREVYIAIGFVVIWVGW